LKLENKKFESAGQGRKLIAKNESDIESIEAALEGKKAQKTFWETRIDLVNRYSDTAS